MVEKMNRNCRLETSSEAQFCCTVTMIQPMGEKGILSFETACRRKRNELCSFRNDLVWLEERKAWDNKRLQETLMALIDKQM